jgi:hypothetical protein
MLRHNLASHTPMRLFRPVALGSLLLGSLCISAYAGPGEGAESDAQVLVEQQQMYRRLRNATHEILRIILRIINDRLNELITCQFLWPNHEVIEFLQTLLAQVEDARIDIFHADAETNDNPVVADANAMQERLENALGLYYTLREHIFPRARPERRRPHTSPLQEEDPQALRQQQERCHRLIDAIREVLRSASREAGERLDGILLGEQIRRLLFSIENKEREREWFAENLAKLEVASRIRTETAVIPAQPVDSQPGTEPLMEGVKITRKQIKALRESLRKALDFYFEAKRLAVEDETLRR